MEILILLGVVGAIMFYVSHMKEKERREALDAYNGSLNLLKQDPANSDMRQKTLSLGRAYSTLMRDKKGNTVFDEVALMNDIGAACASTQNAVHSPPRTSVVAAVESAESRLEKLQSLRDKGLIEDQDFQRRKAEILDSI